MKSLIALTTVHNDDDDDDEENHHQRYNDDLDQELLESEIAAAQDAHDCNDAGMEAAAKERAVMMARELLQNLTAVASSSKKQTTTAIPTESKQPQKKDPHVAHSMDPTIIQYLESDEELLESEIAAAQDAGMEAAAEERAVMMAHELLQNLPPSSKKLVRWLSTNPDSVSTEVPTTSTRPGGEVSL